MWSIRSILLVASVTAAVAAARTPPAPAAWTLTQNLTCGVDDGNIVNMHVAFINNGSTLFTANDDASCTYVQGAGESWEQRSFVEGRFWLGAFAPGGAVFALWDNNFFPGAAYGVTDIFSFNASDGTSKQLQQLRPSDEASHNFGDRFGQGLAFSPANGSLLAVASLTYIDADQDNGRFPGEVYIFVQQGGSSGPWQQTQLIDVPGSGAFGVAISPDGSTLATYSQDFTHNPGSSHVCVYEADEGGVWPQTPTQVLAVLGCCQGIVIALVFSPDGSMLVAPSDDGHITTVFERSASGDWAPSQVLMSNGTASFDVGAVVAFSPDASVLAVGDGVPCGAAWGNCGAVSLYSRIGAGGTWARTQTLSPLASLVIPPNGAPSQFGQAIAFSPDGSALAIAGGSYIDTNLAAAVYMYTLQ